MSKDHESHSGWTPIITAAKEENIEPTVRSWFESEATVKTKKNSLLSDSVTVVKLIKAGFPWADIAHNEKRTIYTKYRDLIETAKAWGADGEKLAGLSSDSFAKLAQRSQPDDFVQDTFSEVVTELYEAQQKDAAASSESLSPSKRSASDSSLISASSASSPSSPGSPFSPQSPSSEGFSFASSPSSPSPTENTVKKIVAEGPKPGLQKGPKKGLQCVIL